MSTTSGGDYYNKDKSHVNYFFFSCAQVTTHMTYMCTWVDNMSRIMSPIHTRVTYSFIKSPSTFVFIHRKRPLFLIAITNCHHSSSDRSSNMLNSVMRHRHPAWVFRPPVRFKLRLTMIETDFQRESIVAGRFEFGFV